MLDKRLHNFLLFVEQTIAQDGKITRQTIAQEILHFSIEIFGKKVEKVYSMREKKKKEEKKEKK